MRCIIIAGSPDTNISFIKHTVKESDFVICADRGYSFAKEAGIMPDVVVGDFDSCNEEVQTECEIVRLSPQKDDTDTIHSIDIAFDRGYSDIVLLGALGGRLDHTYACISALEYIHLKGGRGVLLSENEYAEFLPVGEHIYSGYCGKTFSLFPFGCEKVCISYVGAEYPLDKGCLNSSYPMGVSNIFNQNECKIRIYNGNAIIIINLSETLN